MRHPSELWRLHVNEETAQAITDGNAADIGKAVLFASGRNDQEACLSGPIVYPTSTDDVNGQATEFGVGRGTESCPRLAKSRLGTI